MSSKRNGSSAWAHDDAGDTPNDDNPIDSAPPKPVEEGDAAVIVGGPKKVKDVESDESDEEDPDPPDPQFYLGAATTIGMACFMTFVFNFITTFGEMSGPLVWIVTFCGGALSFFVPFFYYLCSSKHFVWYGKLGDGLLGGIPWLPVGCGVCYVYVVLGTAVKNVGGAKIEQKILMYICVPFYMIIWFPMFLFLLHLQRGDAKAAEEAVAKAAGKRAHDPNKPRKFTNALRYNALIFRRAIVSFVVSSCVSAYMMLPFFGLAWLCVGFYMAWEIHMAIVICVLGVFLIFVIICAIKCPKVVKVPVSFVVQFLTLPLLGWSPRAGGMLPSYDNSLTTDRRIAMHNAQVDKAHKLAADGKLEESKKAMAKANQSRKKIDETGAVLVEEM